MQITVSECPDERFIPYVIQALDYYASKLIKDKRIRNGIKILVDFVAQLDVLAYCAIKGYNRKKQPRSFHIILFAEMGSRQILGTLAHEMVHIKQYMFEELTESQDKWRGKRFNSDDVDYFDYPWEVEAYGREPGLFWHFIKENKLWEVFTDLRDPEGPIQVLPIAWAQIERDIT